MTRVTPTERIAAIQARIRAGKERKSRVKPKEGFPRYCRVCKDIPKNRAKPWCVGCYKLPSAP